MYSTCATSTWCVLRVLGLVHTSASERAQTMPPRKRAPHLSSPEVITGGSTQCHLARASASRGMATPRRTRLPPLSDSRRALARLPLGAVRGSTNNDVTRGLCPLSGSLKRAAFPRSCLTHWQAAPSVRWPCNTPNLYFTFVIFLHVGLLAWARSNSDNVVSDKLQHRLY